MSDEGDAQQRSDAEWAADRARLQQRLDRLKQEQAAATADPAASGSMQGMAAGLKIASEFIAGIAVGGAIGYGIDRLFGTLPVGLVVFLMLGFAAGVLNVVRSTKPKDGPPPAAS